MRLRGPVVQRSALRTLNPATGVQISPGSQIYAVVVFKQQYLQTMWKRFVLRVAEVIRTSFSEEGFRGRWFVGNIRSKTPVCGPVL
uniref:Uncharacterized protein n=1 Tax=Ascaris lumbricoides TaxID=6252 RepID=A0A0M3IB28_ASCLU